MPHASALQERGRRVLALCFVGERIVGSRMTFLNYLNPTYILSMTKLGHTILGYKSNNHVAGKFFGHSTRVQIRSSLVDQLSYQGDLVQFYIRPHPSYNSTTRKKVPPAHVKHGQVPPAHAKRVYSFLCPSIFLSVSKG